MPTYSSTSSRSVSPSRSPEPKRRRVAVPKTTMKSNATTTTQPISSSRYSSPDELAESPASSNDRDYRRRRSSGIAHHQRRNSRKSISYDGSSGTPREAALGDDDESPDELDHTVHTFYRGRARRERGSISGSVSLSGEGREVPIRDSRRPDDRDSRRGSHSRSASGTEEMMTPRSRFDTDDDDDDDELKASEVEAAERELEAEAAAREAEESGVPKPVPFRPYRLKTTLRGHRKGVAVAKFSPDGHYVASGSADTTLRIWDVESGKCVHVLEAHLAGISTISWSPDSIMVASGSDDKSIRLWNAKSGEPHAVPLIGHHNYVYSIAFSPKGNMLVSGSYDEAVFLWDVRGARVMRSLPAHSDPVGGVDFIRDGTLIVSCGGDGLIRVWDTATGQCLRTLVHEDNAAVTSVRFSPNGKFLLAWTLDSCVRLWNYVDGRCLKTYQGHKNVRFSIGGTFGVYSDGKQAFAASGSEDGNLFLWDVTTKDILQRLEGHEGVVLGCDARGELLVSGGLDGTVRIWSCAVEQEEEDGDGRAEAIVEDLEKLIS